MSYSLFAGQILSLDFFLNSHLLFQVLEGSTDATWSVVVRFPDMDALNGWYSSEEYQAVAPKRRELTGGSQSFLIAAPQFEGLPG